MELNLDQNQAETVIAALVRALDAKDEDAGMHDFFLNRLKDRIARQDEEIASLKEKLKALKKRKVTKVTKAIKAPEPVVKRGRGRPKKEI